MNVILLEKIAKLGDIGEAVNVRSGFARNFLFPKGKAVPATRRNLEEFEQRRTELLAAHNEKIAHARERAEKLADLAIRLEVNASDEGRLFGSVSSREVADALNEKAGSDLARSEIILPGGSIRQCGDYEVTVDLGFEVSVTFALAVVNRNAPAEAAEAEAETATDAAIADEAPADDMPASEEEATVGPAQDEEPKAEE